MVKYWLIFLLLCPAAFAAQIKPKMTVYAYHLQPPLIIDIDNQTGLYFDFVRQLNKLSDNYQFELAFVPRKRLEAMLQRDEMTGVLLGVNPKWFKDKAEQKYLWTSTVFTDRDEIVSLKATPLEYQSPNSLKGKVIGGVRGFYYAGINELVARGKVSRVDTAGEAALLTMLTKGRVDAAIIGRSMYDYLVKGSGLGNTFHLSEKPHDSYNRRVLVPKSQRAIFSHLQALITELDQDCLWQLALKQYQ